MEDLDGGFVAFWGRGGRGEAASLVFEFGDADVTEIVVIVFLPLLFFFLEELFFGFQEPFISRVCPRALQLFDHIV